MARKPTDPDIVNLRLRMPESLRKTLAGIAEKSGRSLNSEIVWRLGQSLGPEGEEYAKQYETTEEYLRKKLDELVAEIIKKRKA